MSLLSRYILRLHFAPFIFGFSTVVFLFLMQFLMNHLDKLVGKGLSEFVILELILLNMAWMVILAVPMGVLFSTLMGFGSMSAAHEVTIVKASGGSLFRMMQPVVFAGIVITILLFLFNDYVLPDTNHRAKTLMIDIRRTKPTFSLESGQFSADLPGYTILARHVDSASNKMYGVTIYDNRSSSFRNVISSDSGDVSYLAAEDKMLLTLFYGEIHQIPIGDVNNYRIVNFEKYQSNVSAEGFNFRQTEKDAISRGDREMRISDMQKIVDDAQNNATITNRRISLELEKHFDFLMGVKESHSSDTLDAMAEYSDDLYHRRQLLVTEEVSGETPMKTIIGNIEQRINFLRSIIRSDVLSYNEYDLQQRKYNVEIHKKYAIPVACLLFVIVGCPLGVITRGGNFGISAGISLVFYVFYWACLIGGEKLADRGIISPFISMWAGNFAILITGIMLILRVNYESINFFKFKKRK